MSRTSSPSAGNPPKRSSLGRMINQSTILLMLSIGSLILLLSLLILFHQNANATKGYALRTLKQERTRLLTDEEILNMQIATQQSLKVLESDPQIEAMVPVKDTRYATALPTSQTESETEN